MHERGSQATRVCQHYGISCKTFYKWWWRYQEAGRDFHALRERSRRPHGHPKAVPGATAERLMLGVPLGDDVLVFSALEGKPLRPNTITRAWAMLAARAGVKVIRLHDARHTHASLMLKQGVHPKIVQERLGHASISMTLDTYSHVVLGLQQAAAESFDRLLHRKAENEAAETSVSKMLAKRPLAQLPGAFPDTKPGA